MPTNAMEIVGTNKLTSSYTNSISFSISNPFTYRSFRVLFSCRSTYATNPHGSTGRGHDILWMRFNNDSTSSLYLSAGQMGMNTGSYAGSPQVRCKNGSSYGSYGYEIGTVSALKSGVTRNRANDVWSFGYVDFIKNEDSYATCIVQMFNPTGHGGGPYSYYENDEGFGRQTYDTAHSHLSMQYRDDTDLASVQFGLRGSYFTTGSHFTLYGLKNTV